MMGLFLLKPFKMMIYVLHALLCERMLTERPHQAKLSHLSILILVMLQSCNSSNRLLFTTGIIFIF